MERITLIVKLYSRQQCDYSNAYRLVKLVNRTITVAGQGTNSYVIPAGRNDKQVIIKNCATMTACIT